MITLECERLRTQGFHLFGVNERVTLRTEFILRLERGKAAAAIQRHSDLFALVRSLDGWQSRSDFQFPEGLVHPAATTSAARAGRHTARHFRSGAGGFVRAMRCEGGELLFQFGALAGGTFRLFPTVDDGFELLPTTFTNVFEYWHLKTSAGAASMV
jgi:hypothetical protein